MGGCRGKKSEPDGLSSGVGAVKFAYRPIRGREGGIGHVGCACGTACTVETKRERCDRGDASEEVLLE